MHPWNLTPKEAIDLQRKLRDRIRTDLCVTHPDTVAGVDVSYVRERKESIASVVVLSFPELQILQSAVARMKTPFPYVPGLLSFREIPAILRALEKISLRSDLMFVDGHGRAHPRRFGIASHLGLWLKQPTIGVAKSRLCGDYQEPGKKRGASRNLIHKEELIGRVVRTRTNVKPVFVSIGYGLRLDECVRWTFAVTTRYRLPEPIRRADHLSRAGKS